MTLDELIERRGKPLEKNDYEFVMGDDGLAHIIFCVDALPVSYGRFPRETKYAFSFFCPCGHFAGRETTVGEREISKNLTCLACNAR